VSLPAQKASSIIVLIDTTYWGRNFGVMLFKDATSGRNLLKTYVKYETNVLYLQGIAALKANGFIIQAIVCDGRKGLVQAFKDIPVQMCQFHQSAIIRRYLTKKPKLVAAQELLTVVDLMKMTDKESFEGALGLWIEKWQDFLDERTTSPETGKTFYTHKRLRSAYRSLKFNLPWLFTWYNHPELNIPNTTNAIDGHFADLKNKLRNHNGLSLRRKMKFIDEFLKA
jgi:transposase-like protein